MDAFALLVRRADHAKCSAPIHSCQRTCIAVVDDRIAVVDQLRAMFGHTFVDLYIFIRDALRGIQNQLAHLIRASLIFRLVNNPQDSIDRPG